MHKSIEGFLTGADNPKLEETALLALIGCGHHRQVQVAMFLSEFKPKFELSQEVKKAVSDFLGTRGKKYAKQTIDISKKRRIFRPN